MSIRPDKKYDGVVGPGSGLFETQTGTVAYQVMLECEDGQTSFMIWMTQKNRERAVKSFAVLGIPEDQLKDEQFLEYGLGGVIEGREVAFGTKEEEYKGKTTVKVAWIGKRNGGNLSRAAAKFFGSAEKPEPAMVPGGPITDDDIPF